MLFYFILIRVVYFWKLFLGALMDVFTDTSPRWCAHTDPESLSSYNSLNILMSSFCLILDFWANFKITIKINFKFNLGIIINSKIDFKIQKILNFWHVPIKLRVVRD